MIDPVITVEELTVLDETPAIADVRWYLEDAGLGRREYLKAHIPGAVYVDLEEHLSATDGPGRHPLPGREEFAARLGNLGIGDDHLVVAYDDRGGVIAARLWWMLRDIGHERVRVLDGGIAAWRAAGHEVEEGATTRSPSNLSVHSGPTETIDRSDLEGRLGHVTLLDARPPERYRGDEEPVDPVAGHIPTAKSAPTTGNLDGDERFLDRVTLRRRFEELGVSTERETIVYCGSGVTACHNALSLVRAGFSEPTLYPGSWSDWGTSGGEVAVGSDPGEPS